MVLRSKNCFLLLSPKTSASCFRNPNNRISFPAPSILFPLPILGLTWELQLTWEHWPRSQWLHILKLPANPKCSHAKATEHGRCKNNKKNTSISLSRVKTVPFLSISSISERIKAGGSGLEKITKVGDTHKEAPMCIIAR